MLKLNARLCMYCVIGVSLTYTDWSMQVVGLLVYTDHQHQKKNWYERIMFSNECPYLDIR